MTWDSQCLQYGYLQLYHVLGVQTHAPIQK
jgi:hypothetical protein